jgi:uncharacterized iron-regulated membrane protein
MAWLHTWSGLVTGWVLFFVFVIGSAAFFNAEITRWMKPEWPLWSNTPPPPAAEMAETALDYLVRRPEAARAQDWYIELPAVGLGHSRLRRNPALNVAWTGQGKLYGEKKLDPAIGAELPPMETRRTEGGEVFGVMHYVLHYVNRDIGVYIVLACRWPRPIGGWRKRG